MLTFLISANVHAERQRTLNRALGSLPVVLSIPSVIDFSLFRWGPPEKVDGPCTWYL
jgi:hypothetical protein